MDDHELIQTFLKKRSENAFRNLYRKHTSSLYGLSMRLTHYNQALAEDMVQQCWITAIDKLDQFEGRSSLKTWLCSILINHYRNQKRKNQREVTFEVFKNDRSADDPDNIDLENALASLPGKLKEIVILHDIQGFKHREIAVMLKIKEGTSKSQLFQARKAIREYFNDTTKNGSYD